jgi:hypothetical protein
MCRRALMLLLVAGLTLTAPPAFADWPNSVVKWDQTSPGADNYGAAAWIYSDGQSDALTVDDFLCTQRTPITDLSFAGFFYGGTPSTFRVTFWDDVPGTIDLESHPGNLLKDILVHPADPQDPLRLGWQDLGNGTFKVDLPEADWFYQQGTVDNPRVYWIGIQATDASFYWNFKERNQAIWNDDAGFASNQFGYAPWFHWGWQNLEGGPGLYQGRLPSDWAKSADMSFSLTTVPEPGTILLLAVAGLCSVLCCLRRRFASP